MTSVQIAFNRLKKAEEYLKLFGITYEPEIVNVNCLHILKKFSELMAQIDEDADGLDNEQVFNQYRDALQSAYQLFLASSPLEEKLFKVFRDRPNNVVMLSDIEVEV
jgi:nitrogenase-stabilizing/protective protein